MNYKKVYDQIVERAKHRKLTCYSEWHHVEPRSLGGSDDPSNLVQLTYREHFLVHWLLTKFITGRGRRSMIYALQCMGTMDANGQRFVCSWQYEVARRTIQAHFEKVRLEKIAAIDRGRKKKIQRLREQGIELSKTGKKTVIRRGRRCKRKGAVLPDQLLIDASQHDLRKSDDRGLLSDAASLFLKSHRTRQ